MMTTPTCWLLVALATVGQDPAAEPEEWKRDNDAATAAMEAGDFAKAEALLVQVVHEAQKLDPDDLRQAPPLERLARFYASKGQDRFTEAEPLLRQALAVREKVQGKDHPDLVPPLLGLGICAAKSNDQAPDAADKPFQRALAITEKAHGKDNPEVAKVLHTMAVVQTGCKEFSAAERNFTRAVDISARALGPDNATLAGLLDDFGDLHAIQIGFFDQERMRAQIENTEIKETASERHGRLAHEFYARALTIRERSFKPTDPDIAESLFNLAQLAMIRSKNAEGDAYIERWRAFQKRVGKAPSKETADALRLWAQFAINRKDWHEAQRRLAQAQPTVEQVEGVDSDAVCEFLATRADAALQAKEFEEAERHLKRGLEIQAALCGANDPNIKQAQRLMAGHFQDCAQDAQGFLRWNDLAALSEDIIDQKPENRVLSNILDGYGDLLRQTNKAVPRPSAEDIAFLGGDRVPADVDRETRIQIISGVLETDTLSDATLVHVARCYRATNLSLSGRPVTDDGLVHLKNLTALRHLELDRTQITDAGLAQLAHLEHLKELNLSDTRIGDAGLQHLGRLKSLRTLQLDDTNVTDVGLEGIGKLPALQTISVKGTRVTQRAIEWLRRAKPELRVEYKTLNLPPPGVSPVVEPARVVPAEARP